MIIDGKKSSSIIKEKIKQRVDEIKANGKRVPGLAVVLVGEDPASKVYVGSKIKTCEYLGFHSKKYLLSEDVSEEELLDLILKLNEDETIDGILVQLPLPKHISEEKVIDTIAPNKDVDGFGTENMGKILIGKNDGFIPCTPNGILELLDMYNIELSGKDVTVVGRSNIVGKPIAALLINRSATVTVCHSRTKNLTEKLQKADIIIAAVGIPKFIKKEMIKKGSVIIDVGINRDENGKLCGDIDFKDVEEKVGAITPVPGGVGPMTIAMLMKNTLKSFELYSRD